MRVKIVVSYDGSRFDGFQIQKKTKNTVAGKIGEVFVSLNINSKFQASGRTDKGVHATYQVLSLDLPKFWEDLEKLKIFLNRKLLPHIYVKNIQRVNNGFHARFDAKRRVYRYLISKKEPSVFLTPYVTFLKSYNPKVIKEAVSLFEGEHNFEYFKKNGSDTKNFVRKIYRAFFYEYKNFGVFYFEANGFLRSQVRMMVDFLLKISEGKLKKEDLIRQLSRKEIVSSSLAPPNGLYLSKVKY